MAACVCIVEREDDGRQWTAIWYNARACVRKVVSFVADHPYAMYENLGRKFEIHVELSEDRMSRKLQCVPLAESRDMNWGSEGHLAIRAGCWLTLVTWVRKSFVNSKMRGKAVKRASQPKRKRIVRIRTPTNANLSHAMNGC